MTGTAVTVAVGAVGLAGAGLCWIAAAGATRPDRPGRSAFVLVAGLFATAAIVVVGGFVAGIDVTDGRWHLLVRVPVYLAIGPWLVFVVQFTGRGNLLSGWRTVGLMTPIAAFVVVLTAETIRTWIAVTLLESTGATVAETAMASRLSIAVLSFGLVVYALAFAGMALLLQTSYTNERFPVKVAGTIALAMFGPLVLPFVARSARYAASSTVLVGAYAVGLCLSVLCLWVALVRFDVFNSTAVAVETMARQTIPAELEDAIVVIDDRRRVVDCNATAQETFDVEGEGVIREPFEAVCNRSVDDLTTDAVVSLETTTGPRRFDLQTTRLYDQRYLGMVLSFRDVTSRELREQRIRILNRVLRHNLRNKLAVVRGNAERISATDQPADAAAEIRMASDELLELGEKARAIESVLASQRSNAESVRVTTIVESVVEEARSATDAEIDVAIGTELAVVASTHALEYVVTELVENAIEHNERDTTRLEVTVDGDDQRGRLSVVDDGPGIPERERIAIQRGEESSLVHGSGLGLWGVRWIVTLLGGELHFDANEPRGTIVHIDLPRADGMPPQPMAAAETTRSAAVSDD